MLILRQMKGFTMVELLVALVINLLLFVMLVTVLLTNLNHYRTVTNINRLNQQLQTTLFLMANDIRRAGYWSNATNDVSLDQNTNPFMASGTDMSVNGSNNCILFTYDHNGTGTLPAISSSSDDDRYGYRLMNQAIQSRPFGATFSCTASASNWDNMTDTNAIQITNLTFTLNTSTITTGPNTKGIVQRSVDISITGNLVSNASVTRTLTSHVRIRNDKFIP